MIIRRLLLLLGLFVFCPASCERRYVELISDPGGGTEAPPDAAPPEGADDTSFGPADTASEAGTASDPEATDREPGDACRLGVGDIRVTELDVGVPVIANEEEAALKLIALSPIPGGGSRLAWMEDDNTVRVATLDAADAIVDNSVAIPAADLQDLHATAGGGVLLLTRDALGGGVLGCGDEDNLCNVPEPPIPCYDMYLVRFEGATEVWATPLTTASEALPPYGAGPTGPSATLIWWYAHHGRIASSGASFAAYFGSAISVSTGACVDIHQGDRMRIVDQEGTLLDGGFGWGCSPSGYEQVIWNSAAHAYVAVCKSETAASGVAAFAPDKSVIWSVDPWYANLGELVLAENGGYWLALSDRKPGQPERSAGLAEVHLLQFTSGAVNIRVTVSLGKSDNVRAPHLARFGQERLLLLYESSASPGELAHADDRAVHVELRSREDGSKLGETVRVPGVTGHRYHALRAFHDGSVAMAVKGDAPNSIKILRVLPCDGT